MNKSLDLIIHHVQQSNIEWMPIKEEHILRVSNLPFHHRDPFDRIHEGLTIITKDDDFKKYPVTVIWNKK